MATHLDFLSSYSPNALLMISVILASLIILSAIAAIVYYAGIQPARTLERWLSMFVDGERLPDRVNVGFRYWLLPVHQELKGVEKKLRKSKEEVAQIKDQLIQTQFLHNYILSSLIEAIVVVDEKREVTLVNSEFMHLYQQTQSPMGRTLADVAEDQRLDQIVELAFSSMQVQGGRITKASSGDVGRHPAFNVSAIPVCATEGKINAVIILLLPLADRPRMMQVMKRHSERLHRLMNQRPNRQHYPVDSLEKFECRPFVIADTAEYLESLAYPNESKA